MIIVRSQNKEILVETTNFRICRVLVNGEITHYTINCEVNDKTVFAMGRYSTKEKALKVLDMIEENCNKPTYVYKHGTGEYYKYDHLSFQMPQDDEVEE